MFNVLKCTFITVEQLISYWKKATKHIDHYKFKSKVHQSQTHSLTDSQVDSQLK